MTDDRNFETPTWGGLPNFGEVEVKSAQASKCLRGEHEAEDIVENVFARFQNRDVCLPVCRHCRVLYVAR